MPVVIDDTNERDAQVPDRFFAVQWTHLPGGETPPAFAGRVQALLAGPIMETERPRPVARDEGVAAPRAGQWRGARIWLWVAVAVVAVAAVVIWQPWRKQENPTSRLATPVSDAQQLVQQALTLLRGQPEKEITVTSVFPYFCLWVFPERRDEIIDALTAFPHASPHAWLRFHPIWDPLRGDPRFEKLLRDTLPRGAKPFDDQKPAASPAPEAKK